VPILHAVSQVDVWNDATKQAIDIGWNDNNDYEEGWIIQRKIYGTSGWITLDTLPMNGGSYVSHKDYDYTGGETYSYRVRPFGAGQNNVAYSPEFHVTSRPNRPLSMVAHATDYRRPIPVQYGCGSNNLSKLNVMSKVMTDAPPEYDDDTAATNCHALLGNDITVAWSPDPQNKYPITEHYIKRCIPPATMGTIYHVGLDTCLWICPNPERTNLDIYVYGIASNGDTSVPISGGVCTGAVNSCPGAPNREIDSADSVPQTSTEISQNSPNPFNSETTIKFSLGKNTHVRLVVFDILGRIIRIIRDIDLPKGIHKVIWDGKDNSGVPVASGVYFYRIEAGEYKAVKKMILLK
jgi:hypothetical protein